MQKTNKHQRPVHAPVNTSNDDLMVAVGLRVPKIERPLLGLSKKKRYLSDVQVENLSKIKGLNVTTKTTELEALRLLRRIK